jgi:hypothetical protein
MQFDGRKVQVLRDVGVLESRRLVYCFTLRQRVNAFEKRVEK